MEKRNNGKGIFYGVIGVATLVVAIIGATFAYFTASASNNNVITGDMATVSLSLSVAKVSDIDTQNQGMIPMSNGMVEAAALGSGNVTCKDDNGNAVCQIYKITLTNSSSAGQFVDGYVSLKGGSGVPTDWNSYANGEATSMRWAQVFQKLVSAEVKDGEKVTKPAVYNYSTKGDVVLSTLGKTAGTVTYATAIEDAATGHNEGNIKTAYSQVVTDRTLMGGSVSYPAITSNYIRVSDHAWAASGDETYNRNTDITSALVFNQNVAADSAAEYYIVVWLSETGTDQTADSGETAVPESGLDFFSGNVTFISAQGSEVSATFSSYSRVDKVS